jgi:glutaredoxin
MAEIILYQFETCPFCEKVRNALDAKNIEYKKVNVSADRDDPARKDLLEKSGVATVPVIDIDGKFMGESGDIVAYIEENF